jgi:hypothetical protein
MIGNKQIQWDVGTAEGTEVTVDKMKAWKTRDKGEEEDGSSRGILCLLSQTTRIQMKRSP